MLSLAFSGQGQGRVGNAPNRDRNVDEMVQDPCCKVYVPVSRAVTARSGGQTLYFCSEDCAKKYSSNGCG